MPTSSSTFQNSSFSYSSSTVNGQTHSQSQTTHSDPSGTKVHQTSQEPGQARREERFEYDASGRRLPGAGPQGRVEDVTGKEQAARDEEYKERMDEEYAKREGGA